MNKITWTDRPDGRQFWEWNAQKEEWVKTGFFTWNVFKIQKAVSEKLKLTRSA